MSAVLRTFLRGVAVPCRAHHGAHLESDGQLCFCSRSGLRRFVGSRSERVGYNSNALVNRV